MSVSNLNKNCFISKSFGLKNTYATSNFLGVSIWEKIDLVASQWRNSKLNKMIDNHNNSRPKTHVIDKLGRKRSLQKGCILGNHIALVRVLMYLCLCQLEDLRKSGNSHNQMQYQACLASDRLSVTTNRKELFDKMNANYVKVCKNTISNSIELLIEACIIIEKRNTSRRRVKQEDGTVTYLPCENGRGDFQLFLPKELFCFTPKYQYLVKKDSPETPKTSVDKISEEGKENLKLSQIGKKAFIDYQSVRCNQSQNLGQIISYIPKTKTIINNNCGKLHSNPIGVPSGLEEDYSGQSPQPNKLERKSKIPKSIAAGRGRQNAAGVLEMVSDNRKLLCQGNVLAERKITLSRQVDRLIPEKARTFYLEMLQILFISMLYPDLDRLYLGKIKSDLIQMLGIYFDRIPCKSPADAFRKLSRAVEMVYQYRKRHNNHCLYRPLSYLRVDFEKGFRNVVDNWLPKEDSRLKLHAKKGTHLLKWQMSQAYADDLFEAVMEALRKGLFQSQSIFSEAEIRLNDYLDRVKAGEQTKVRIKTSFSNRFHMLVQELIKQASENEDNTLDPTWRTFLRYQDQINRKAI